MITEIQFQKPNRYEDITVVKLEKSKGVRKCKSCGADIFPEVLCVRLHRLVPCNFKRRRGKTVFEPGIVASKENYCVMCAGPIMEIILDMCPKQKQYNSKNSKYQILREINRIATNYYKYICSYVKQQKQIQEDLIKGQHNGI